jgi:16S rRNA (cytosine1402-N4)-methyltransferase
MEKSHISVQLQESIDALALKPGMTYFDGTVGLGGHCLEVAKRFGTTVAICGTDRDSEALAEAEKRLKAAGIAPKFIEGNYRNAPELLRAVGISSVDAVLLDLGLSSMQLDASGRGFSFRFDEPLHMTFESDPERAGVTAEKAINSWSEETLADIIYAFADERYARRIAKAIVAERAERQIATTFELVEVIRRAVPAAYRHGKTHFATKTFQALRMAVNEEVVSITEGIKSLFEFLAPHGRMAVITFHSVEDRIVKNLFRDFKDQGRARLIFKKFLPPSESELQSNPRARSAKLRALEKNG